MDWIAWIGFGFLISLYSSGFHYLMWYLLNIFPWFAKLVEYVEQHPIIPTLLYMVPCILPSSFPLSQ